MIINNTPIESYFVGDKTVYVKREDLCAPEGAPPFSKIRGLVPVLKRLKAEGVKTVGYTETSVSMAGWGVAWGCQMLGLKAVIFDPQYKETPSLLAYHRKQWAKYDAEIIPIKAGMAKVNYYVSRGLLFDNYDPDWSGKAVMLPLGLPFPETIDAAEEEAKRTILATKFDARTIVINVGSGTVAAGVLRAYRDKTVVGVMGRTGSIEGKRKVILKKAGLDRGGFFNNAPKDFRLVDPGWEYTERSHCDCPFPSHPWYDLKAFQWLVENIKSLEGPILFWNIGRVA